MAKPAGEFDIALARVAGFLTAFRAAVDGLKEAGVEEFVVVVVIVVVLAAAGCPMAGSQCCQRR